MTTISSIIIIRVVNIRLHFILFSYFHILFILFQKLRLELNMILCVTVTNCHMI